MLISQNLFKTKKTVKAANKAGKNKGKKPAAGDPRPKTRPKALKRRAVVVKLKTTLAAPRTRRTQTGRKTKMNHVSQILFSHLNPVIPPILDHVSVALIPRISY